MYREAGPLPCPQCGDPLAAFTEARAKWRCRQCGGTLVGAEELAVEIGEHSLERVNIKMNAPCPRCHEPMVPMRLRDQFVAQCSKDGYVWFERGVIGLVRKALLRAEDTRRGR
jgi:ribosomal protein L37AE/L43A